MPRAFIFALLLCMAYCACGPAYAKSRDGATAPGEIQKQNPPAGERETFSIIYATGSNPATDTQRPQKYQTPESALA